MWVRHYSEFADTGPDVHDRTPLLMKKVHSLDRVNSDDVNSDDVNSDQV